MASDLSDPFALNIRGVTDLVQNRTNKVDGEGGDDPEGVVSEKFDALDLKMSDEELLKLRDEWEMRYKPYESKIEKVFVRNKEAYTGRRSDGQWLAGDDNIAGNLIFEAEETFLAAALAKNPEPVVWCDNTKEGNAIATAVKTMLQFHSDQLVLQRKLTLMVRQWSIYHLGVIKHGWDSEINDVIVKNRKIQDFVFDPEGYVNAFGDFSSYLGERITVTAEKLIELFPKHKAYIELVVDHKLGTPVTYTEWWTDRYCYSTFKRVVLDKHKNQYFKYPEPVIDPITNEASADPITGQAQMTAPLNHFAVPKKPYTFLSVYSLQEQPHDITGLIEQNIPNQKLIAKRIEQIDYNISKSNNSHAYSEDNFNQETAKQAANAQKKGNPILVPSGGPIDKAIMPLPAQSLPNDVFTDLENNKQTLLGSFGVQGLLTQPKDEDQTARGMILNQAHDTTRIGGGIGESIEQVADSIFNWLTQLYYVFYDEQHFAAIMGRAKAVEYQQFSSADLTRQLIVSVAPDSMRPRDDITTMNLAQTLFDKGAIGPKTLLKMVDFPDVDEAAADGVMYKLDPMAYFQMNFPEYAAQLQQMQQQNAMVQMQNQAQGAGMNAQATAQAKPPEGVTEPNLGLNSEPASAALSNVKLPPLQQQA